MNTASETSTANPANIALKAPRIRWWIPWSILALAAANLVRLRSATDLEGNFKNMQTFMTIGFCRRRSACYHAGAARRKGTSTRIRRSIAKWPGSVP